MKALDQYIGTSSILIYEIVKISLQNGPCQARGCGNPEAEFRLATAEKIGLTRYIYEVLGADAEWVSNAYIQALAH